jgi:hypothetical protein
VRSISLDFNIRQLKQTVICAKTAFISERADVEPTNIDLLNEVTSNNENGGKFKIT